MRGGRGAKSRARVRYRFGVRNKGSVAATDVKVHVRLPRLLTHLRGGRRVRGVRSVVFNLGRIGPGAGKSRAMSARVGPGAAGRKILVRARVTLRSPVPAPSRAASTASMPTVRAPVTSGAPRQRYVAAYGLCRIVVRD